MRDLYMATFSPVSSNKLYIQIYNQIHDAIVSGEYKVGDKLPSEKEFCTMFNVSRVPVREALCALELNGLVDSIQGVGVYVKERPAQINSEWMQNVEPQEIIRARMVLEPDIAREAALHIKQEEKERLQAIIERFGKQYEAGLETNEPDREFHLCVAKASGSTLYDMLMTIIFETMEQELWELILNKTVYTDKYRQQNYEEHYYIGRAIIDGRADDAHALMKEHMYRLYERYWSPIEM